MAERIDDELDQFAKQGEIDEFYKLIEKDVKLLERIDKLPFAHTPLHISASAGHISFSLEMMILKPSFVSKRNKEGHTPIHLALKQGHTEIVCQLLQHNADLVRVRGSRECMTPLHYAARREGLDPLQYEAKTKDYLALLEKIILLCPDSITDVTTQNKTALHIALENNNLEAFKFLVGWLLRKWPSWREILEQKDVEGNTVLHIAVSKKQTQAMSDLLEWRATFFNVNEKNLADQTALDILNDQEQQIRADILDEQEQQSQEAYISKMRELVGELTASSLVKKINQVRKPISDEKRNALLVVAALLVIVTYQAAITPPGGLWQDDEANTTAPHRAGSAIARGTFPFSIFMAFNSIIFLSSIATVAVLVPPDDGVGAILAGVSVSLYISYFSSLMIITQAPGWLAKIVLFSPFIIITVGYAFFTSVDPELAVDIQNGVGDNSADIVLELGNDGAMIGRNNFK